MKRYIGRARGRVAALALIAALVAPAAAHGQEPRRITYDDAIRIALEQSTDVARAANQVELGEISVSEMRQRFLPDLSLSVSNGQSYGRSFNEAEGGLINQTTNTTNLRLGSSVTLFDGFANVANLRSAQLGAEATGLDAARTRQTVVFNVISGYLSVTEAQEQLRVAEESLATEEQREQQVRVLVDAGSRPISELYQQQATVAAARAAVVDARRAHELAQLALVQEMQLNPTGEYVFEAPPLDAADSPPAAAVDVASLVERALALRPDLRAIGADVAAAEQGVRAAQAGRWPTVSLSAGYGSNVSSAADLGWIDQLDQRQSGSLSVGISLPILDRRATSLAVQRADVQVENAQLALADARQQVAVEVQRAVLDRTSAAAALEAAEARVAAAEQALDATERRYQAGLATLFEVAQTRAGLVDATSAVVRARYNLLFQDAVLGYYTGELDVSAAAAE